MGRSLPAYQTRLPSAVRIYGSSAIAALQIREFPRFKLRPQFGKLKP
ncbi:MAG: hypothetical protein F6K28_41140 [Microcoleus sp. SIO2G3]|nr:hypothetical protein [Microcoleus sp. SIO2G3]